MSESILSLQSITKHFGQKKALNGISFAIHQGEIMSLLGVNGAGKTTLSSIIATLHPPTSGTILFNKKSIYDDIIYYRTQIGYCPQKLNLNNLLTLRENLIAAGRYYGVPEDVISQRIEELADQLILHEYLDQLPGVLSGGYKQRFSIARSLIHNPAIVILDEPTVALDPHVRRQIWQIIKNLKNKGITVLLTTHYLDEAEQLSDRVCVLDKGNVVLIDTPKNLLQSFEKGTLEEVFLHLMQEQEA